MKIEEYNKIIEDATREGTVIATFIGKIDDVEFLIGNCGGGTGYGDKFIAYLIDDDTSPEMYYDSFEEAMYGLRINGKAISDQIDKIVWFEPQSA